MFLTNQSSQGGVGDERDGERVERWREVRARTLTGKTVLAVLRRLNDGQVGVSVESTSVFRNHGTSVLLFKTSSLDSPRSYLRG